MNEKCSLRVIIMSINIAAKEKFSKKRSTSKVFPTLKRSLKSKEGSSSEIGLKEAKEMKKLQKSFVGVSKVDRKRLKKPRFDFVVYVSSDEDETVLNSAESWDKSNLPLLFKPSVDVKGVINLCSESDDD